MPSKEEPTCSCSKVLPRIESVEQSIRDIRSTQLEFKNLILKSKSFIGGAVFVISCIVISLTKVLPAISTWVQGFGGK